MTPKTNHFKLTVSGWILVAASCIGTGLAGVPDEAARPSPLDLKRQSIARLEQVTADGKRLQKIIEEAIEAIEQSLGGKEPLFLDGYRILPPPAGNRVFVHEREAVDRLQQGLRDGDTEGRTRTLFEEVVQALVEADRGIAAYSIEAARSLSDSGCLDGNQLKNAEAEFEAALAQPDPKLAITGFGKAWRFLQNAFGSAGLLVTGYEPRADVFSPSLTAHLLTLEIEASRRPPGNALLEVVEIVRDSSGNRVRTISRRYDWRGGSTRLTASLEWDGRGEAGAIAADGRYAYTAFARLIRGKGASPCGTGNSVSAPVTGTILLDGTPPVITAAVTPGANVNGWHRTDVRIEFRAEDDLSGVVRLTPPLLVTTEGAGQVFAGVAQDAAGNRARLEVVLHIDKTPPEIDASRRPLPNLAGWNNGPVTVSFDAIDVLSGIESSTPDVTVTSEGTRQLVRGEAVDRAGNRTIHETTVDIDLTPPVITVTTASDDRCDPLIELVGTVQDALSGVGRLFCNGLPIPISGSGFRCQVQLASGENHVFVAAEDRADNERVELLTLDYHDADLELLYVDEFELRWDDAGSGAAVDGAFHAPVVPPGYHALGHYADIDTPNGFVFAARALKPGVLAPPEKYRQIWNDGGSGATLDGAIWRPVCPAGYASLGAVAVNSKTRPPSLDEVSCVRQDLLAPARIGNQIYSDHGGGARQDLGAWQIVPADENGVFLGTFTAIRDKYAPPRDPLFTIDVRKIRRPFQGCTSLSPSDAEIERLVEEFGPIIQFHPEERFLMDDPERVLDESSELTWGLVENEDEPDAFRKTELGNLVVLSGCRTALGREVRGEGLVGLTRGFMYAGAPRVVASLWQVEDRATAALMTEFYRNLWREGLAAPAALRSAQLAVRARRRWRDPYFWAGFVLQGEWR